MYGICSGAVLLAWVGLFLGFRVQGDDEMRDAGCVSREGGVEGCGGGLGRPMVGFPQRFRCEVGISGVVQLTPPGKCLRGPYSCK